MKVAHLPDVEQIWSFELRIADYLAESEHGYVRAADAIDRACADTGLNSAVARRTIHHMIAAGRLEEWVQNRAWKSVWRIERAVSDRASRLERLLRRAIRDETLDIDGDGFKGDMPSALWTNHHRYDESGDRPFQTRSTSKKEEVFKYVSKRTKISRWEFDTFLKISDWGWHSRGDTIEPWRGWEPLIRISNVKLTLPDVDLPPPEHDDKVLASVDVPTPAWVRSEFKRNSLLISKALPCFESHMWLSDRPHNIDWSGGLRAVGDAWSRISYVLPMNDELAEDVQNTGARAYEAAESYLQKNYTGKNMQELCSNLGKAAIEVEYAVAEERMQREKDTDRSDSTDTT